MRIKTTLLTQPIADRVNFENVRYANCWEDADVLVAAISPKPGMNILSIASAGDNVLSLAARGANVTAVDISQPQLACLELKIAGFSRLSYSDLLSFLGVLEAANRLETWQAISDEVSDSSRQYWNSRLSHINQGIIHCGKFEQYFSMFRRWILPLIHSQSVIRQLLHPKEVDERRQFWDRRWNTWRWRLLYRLFFNRVVMGRLGRDPEFFRFAEGSVAEQTIERTQYALTELSTHDNPYLTYISTGNFGDVLPDYLQRKNYDSIRSHLQNISLHHCSLETYVAADDCPCFDGFNLSDVFEYVDEKSATDLYGSILKRANVGARIAFWETFVPRNLVKQFKDRARPMHELARELHLRDRAFFYRQFQVDEVYAAE